ncbi:hypothetical protein SDC9_85999 [bioreactor metagenome]|uniref:Uncharacterized protein n=1 Tax=bioreactor metagenome TaxID=1076179 RepID=A0A644ZET2_9ZZZZ
MMKKFLSAIKGVISELVFAVASIMLGLMAVLVVWGM